MNSGSILVKFNGEMYDLTSYLDKHPGGASILITYNNMDITKIMEDIGHSNEAYSILKKLK